MDCQWFWVMVALFVHTVSLSNCGCPWYSTCVFWMSHKADHDPWASWTWLLLLHIDPCKLLVSWIHAWWEVRNVDVVMNEVIKCQMKHEKLSRTVEAMDLTESNVKNEISHKFVLDKFMQRWWNKQITVRVGGFAYWSSPDSRGGAVSTDFIVTSN